MNQTLSFLETYAKQNANLVADSRLVSEGDVFLAYQGASTNGNKFIEQAISNGAIAIVADQVNENLSVPNIVDEKLISNLGYYANEYHQSPSSKLTVIAITGTKGKTTTALWCQQLMSTPNDKVGYIGTAGVGINNDLSKEYDLTTPGVIELHKVIAKFVEQGCSAVTIEASSHALAQNRLANIDCDIAVFTNLGQDHLDYHQNMQEYFAAKLKLFTRAELDYAIINTNDPNSSEVINRAKGKVFTCGHDSSCDLSWDVLSNNKNEINIKYDNQNINYSMPIYGKHNCENLVLAVAASIVAGVNFSEIEKRLDNIKTITGRFEKIANESKNIYVDFAHTPESLELTLKTLQENYANKKIVCLFGCGGSRDKSKRKLMGEVASKYAHQVILTTDNPREENALDIINDIKEGCNNDVIIIEDRKKAISTAVDNLATDEILLVAGKGDETEIIYKNNRKVNFNDSTFIKSLLENYQ